MAGRLFAILLVLVGTSEIAAECFAWGATGHEWVSGIAIEKLGSGPTTLPMPPSRCRCGPE